MVVIRSNAGRAVFALHYSECRDIDERSSTSQNGTCSQPAQPVRAAPGSRLAIGPCREPLSRLCAHPSTTSSTGVIRPEQWRRTRLCEGRRMDQRDSYQSFQAKLEDSQSRAERRAAHRGSKARCGQLRITTLSNKRGSRSMCSIRIRSMIGLVSAITKGIGAKGPASSGRRCRDLHPQS